METSENPGLPRLSPRPHTEALGTRLDKTLTIYINFGKFKLEKAPNFVTKPASNVDRRTPFGSEKKCGMHISEMRSNYFPGITTNATDRHKIEISTIHNSGKETGHK